MTHVNDPDPQETQEWLEALDGVLSREGPGRARHLLTSLVERAHQGGAHVSLGVGTPYINTIPPEQQPPFPGNDALETRLRHYARWNAMAMVARANKESSELGGHVASYASAATLYDVGFNHFFHAPSEHHGGDLVFIQGHSSPGIYARAYLEGRISEEQLENFRQEVGGHGLASYPHPWLMPDFWQFATVSMGLGPIMAIYQARFMKYLHNRGIAETSGRKVWAFLGDGETDEPESLGAISLAGREQLDNLIFVVNCNLQRLDGPVRGNGKIIQELEGGFRGAGWNVIKVVWGTSWDTLLAKDKTGRLVQLMNECLDGDYQTFKAHDGKYVRDNFFGRYPETAALVADWTDEEIWRLQRGGHDPRKVYAAYKAAVETTGQPTVILAKTIKGYGMGSAGEAQNIAHQQKHLDVQAVRAFRDRFSIPVSDERLEDVPFYRPPENSPEMEYLRERQRERGSLPKRRRKSFSLETPALDAFESQLKDSGDREISTTMAFVRILNTILKDKEIGKRVVPIVADESRTFGMEGMFRQLGIYSPFGQLYTPPDIKQLMYYREDQHGQILQEGINEAGAMSSWIAAATSYSTNDQPMIPFYIFYSMFGFQRIGDLSWAAGDMRSRGFLIGGTSGRTTLNGEGLQHEDGHSQVFASFIPNCVSYDPTYGYEVAVIIQDGLRRMYAEQEDVYYYITVLNENYHHPEMPKGAEEGILKGMYLLRDGGKGDKKTPRVQLLGSGAILREVLAAADLLAADFGVAADVWSVTSFNQLRRDGLDAQRHNLLHPEDEARQPYVAACLDRHKGPVVAATDYIKTFADQIRPFIDRRYYALGTDGFGRSDFRRKLREFFEVNRHYVVLAALRMLADEGAVPLSTLSQAIAKYGIDPAKPNPATV
ncbi:MAG TPA: pyruvate dehydrogenase (acetyl-transferring), homodimeric type [Candidatus Dormibacteraeota bacterium]|nr:pyruvate dehydrogenase (acetyl-transferring), homodimeric type [Candidatus Dormibacteraeota bacterium]